MRAWLSVAALAIAAGLAAGMPAGPRAEAGAAALSAAGFAVLELFTSEGCSSCPPADRLLAELAREHAANPDLIVLSFHVDYWNDLGWRDPWSAREFSVRQRRHAAALARGRVYTPQLVVNGRAETVGSRAAAVRALVAQALQTPPTPGPAIALSASAEGRDVLVRHRVTGAPRAARLSLLLVQNEGRSRVTRGENAARVLHHVQIVRSLEPAFAGGSTRLRLPADLAARAAAVVALLEPAAGQTILAAARAPIVPRP